MSHESDRPGIDLPSAADFERIEGQLFERIRVRYRRQVVRHRLVAVAAVLVIAGAGVAAGTVANPLQQSRFANCYGGSTTSAQVAQLALNTGATQGGTSTAGITKAREKSAVLICQAAWRAGVFSKATATGPFPVPNLQVCVRGDLAVDVLRKQNKNESADAFCNNLGLSAP